MTHKWRKKMKDLNKMSFEDLKKEIVENVWKYAVEKLDYYDDEDNKNRVISLIAEGIKQGRKQLISSIKPKEIWHNCIHKHIGSFTLTQEKRAIEDIKKYLNDTLPKYPKKA